MTRKQQYKKATNIKILYIYNKTPHQAHRFEASVLNAEVRSIYNIPVAIKSYQLVVSEGFRPFIVGSLMKRMGLAKKHVNILMGDFMLTSIYYKNFLPLALFKAFLPGCEGFVASSTFVSEIFTSIFNISEDKVRVVNPQAYIKPFIDVKHETSSLDPCIVYLGHLSYFDGADMLPKIFEKVNSEIPNINFFVIGKGPLFEKLLLKSKSINRFHVLGYRPVDYIKEIFRKSVVLVYPARMKAFGLPVMEGMAAGLIPIVTKTTGARDLVVQVDPNLVVPFNPSEIARKIIDVLSMPTEKISEMSRKARYVALEAYRLAPLKFVDAIKYFIMLNK